MLPGDKFVLGSAIGNITYQASQILGFVAGAAVVAVLDPHKTLGIDAVTFGLSALILLTGVRSRPAPGRACGAVAQLIGAPLAVGLAGLVGLAAATMLAMSWTHLRGLVNPGTAERAGEPRPGS